MQAVLEKNAKFGPQASRRRERKHGPVPFSSKGGAAFTNHLKSKHNMRKFTLLGALVLFCIVKAFNKMNEAKAKKEAEEKAAAAAAAAAVPPAKPADIALLEEIRDLLKKN